MSQTNSSTFTIASELDCSPSTVLNELRRGTGERNGTCGRFPSYSAKRGQANYEINRSKCHKNHKVSKDNPFIIWVTQQVKSHKWSLDACVGYAKKAPIYSIVIPQTRLQTRLWHKSHLYGITYIKKRPPQLVIASYRGRFRCLNLISSRDCLHRWCDLRHYYRLPRACHLPSQAWRC